VQLSLHAEYALRVLLYLGSQPDRVVSTAEISDAFGISKNHLVRVMHTLSNEGYLHLIPGRTGGVALAKEPHLIRLGDVVRQAEPTLRLAECFDIKTNTCVIAPFCSLRPVLKEALESFMTTMNAYTLADLLAGGMRDRIAKTFVTIASRDARDA
jgi:Rrf2 family transcriptional regulator, nitric oxide-sensitive transcriptional repressor